MFDRFLRVTLCDPVASSRGVLALWVESEADALELACKVDTQSALPAGTAGAEPRLLFVSDHACEMAGTEMAAQALAVETGIVCRYGREADERGRTGKTLHVSWPMSRSFVRRMLALSVASFGESTGGNGGASCPLGHPMPQELAGLMPRLVDTVEDLLAQCTQAQQTHNVQAGRSAAHTLKGAAMSFGQLVCAELADYLLDAFRAGNMEEAAEGIALIRSLLHK